MFYEPALDGAVRSTIDVVFRQKNRDKKGEESFTANQ
jgi:hypothetical protein